MLTFNHSLVIVYIKLDNQPQGGLIQLQIFVNL